MGISVEDLPRFILLKTVQLKTIKHELQRKILLDNPILQDLIQTKHYYFVRLIKKFSHIFFQI